MEEITRALDLIGITLPQGLSNISMLSLIGVGFAVVVVLWLLFRKKKQPQSESVTPPALAPVEAPQSNPADEAESGDKPEEQPIPDRPADAVDARLATLEGRGGDLAASVLSIRQLLESGDRETALETLRALGDSEHRAARDLRDRARTQSVGASTIKLATGDMCMGLEDFAAASQQFSQAIEALPREQDSMLAECLNKHGLASYHAGKLDDAASSFKRAGRVLERIRGLNHPDVATTLNNLAMVHQVRGDLAAAESLYQRALKIDEAAIGNEEGGQSLDVAADLNNLALLYMNQHLYEDAAPLLQRSLDIKEALLDVDHPSLDTGRRNYAELQRALSETDATGASD